jgi:hypothetical protein
MQAPTQFHGVTRREGPKTVSHLGSWVKVLRQHLRDGHAEVDDTRRATLDGVLKKAITPHIKAKMILMRLFDISARYTRKLIYGW